MFAISRNFVYGVISFNTNNVILVYRSVSSGGAGAAKTGIQSRWRKLWSRWIPIPTGVGITLLAVLQWRNIRNKQIQEQKQLEKPIIRDWEITCYRSVPLRPLSRAWGWISDRPVPASMRQWVYGNYSRYYSVNLEEVENDLNSYVSLAEFFSRRLKDGVRPIDVSQCIVSPADGRILNSGEVTSCHIEQVKGVTYSIQTFLGDMNWKQLPYIKSNYLQLKDDMRTQTNQTDTASVNNNVINNNDKNSIDNDSFNDNNNYNLYNLNISQLTNKTGSMSWNHYKRLLLKNPDKNELYQFVVYLAPGDYHRFHSPVQWHVHYRRHFQGELLSVNPKIASWVPELFSLNERVIYFGEWEHGFFSMAAVGATNVGSIRVNSDKTLHTNGRKWTQGIRYKDKALDLIWNKGEEVGEFRMGSTIVVLFEAPRNCKFSIEPNQRIKVGESITCVPAKVDSNHLEDKNI